MRTLSCECNDRCFGVRPIDDSTATFATTTARRARVGVYVSARLVNLKRRCFMSILAGWMLPHIAKALRDAVHLQVPVSSSWSPATLHEHVVHFCFDNGLLKHGNCDTLEEALRECVLSAWLTLLL